ncbi:hypothetical protein VTJ04DRAFT_5114 [Mycothermus thermophilus]|uniref:uncharacterized protein n=1 Tax=Humicola insolens TaxID=85995 RepID=UPI003742046A
MLNPSLVAGVLSILIFQTAASSGEGHAEPTPIACRIFGLAVAKTFRQLNPDKTLLILDSGSTLGGVWSRERHYPGLKTNNMIGTMEYPDFPMDGDEFNLQPGDHIPGETMHVYLAKYARRFGILSNIRYRCKVDVAEHQDGPDGGWMLSVREEGVKGEKRIYARKLVVATGMTSEPVKPVIEGEEQFGAPVFHCKDFGKHADTLCSAKRVAVLGGTKSAWDVAYSYASSGVEVDWIIRESGHGPVWMAPPYVTPFKKWLEKLVHIRLLTWFSPCIWGDVDGYGGIRRFLHGTSFGRAITNIFWKVLGNDVLTLNKYTSHPEVLKLKPWTDPMFVASGFSILNYPTNIFDLVRAGAIRVHIADVTALTTRTVHLSDGTQLVGTDALCCATGWKHVPPVRFVLADGTDAAPELGLPHDPATSDELFSREEMRRADEEILARFPRLRNQPVMNKDHVARNIGTGNRTATLAPKAGGGTSSLSSQPVEEQSLTPWTLYRFMVPPSTRFLQTRDIAFAGILMNFSTLLVAHAQALWITAYFAGQLAPSVIPSVVTQNSPLTPSPSAAGTVSSVSADPKAKAKASSTTEQSLASLRSETLLHARFGRWRYPFGRGAQFPDFVFDAVPYLDLLLRDLGLETKRKKLAITKRSKGGMFAWLKEVVEPYGPEDYKGLVEEFVQLRKEGV